MIRPFVAVLVAALATVPGFAAAQEDALARAQTEGVLRVANTQGHPPWDFIDETGELDGLGVDLAREVARRMGVAGVDFVSARFADLIPGLQAGRFDLVIAGHTITPEREEVVDFTDPYMVVGTSVFTAGTGTTIASLDDLPGTTIGVLAGSIQEGWLAENYPDQITVRTYQNPTLALGDLAVGRVDGVIYSNDAGSYIAAQRDLDVVAAVPVDSEVNAMVVAEGQDSLREAVNAALAEMIADGTYARLSTEWLGGLDMAAELIALDQ